MQQSTKTEPTAVKTTRNLSNDPQYFGSYLNMARHNVFLLINHLADVFKQLKLGNITDDGQVGSKNILLSIFSDQVFDKLNLEDERHKVYNYILKRHHLPLIKIFNSNYLKNEDRLNVPVDYSRLHNFLQAAFSSLTTFRNVCTHYLAIDDDGYKKDRKFEVSSELKSEIQLLFKHAPRYSFLRNQQTLSKDAFDEIQYFSLFEPNSNILSEHGLYFFINLFLERTHATQFLKRFPVFKDDSTPPFKALLQTFTTYCIKVPDIKLGNENPKQSLLLEMLTELNKCPKELFYHLSKKDKQEFEPKLDFDTIDQIALNSINYYEIPDDQLENAIKELSAWKRHEDRFPYFALRYLDETHAFKNLRFQITLGKLVIDKYDKHIIHKVQNRTITKTINVFGKLSDFLRATPEETEKLKQEIINDVRKGFEPDTNIEFEQFAPHYNISTNNIAFYMFDDNDSIKIKKPNTFDKTKKDIHELRNNPTGILSVHNLPKLLVLKTCFNYDIESVIKTFIDNRNKLMLNKNSLSSIKSGVTFEMPNFTKKTMDDEGLLRLLPVAYDFVNEHLDVGKVEFARILKNKRDIKDFAKNPTVFRTTIEEAVEELHARKRYILLMEKRRKELEQVLITQVKYNQLPENVRNYLINLSFPDTTKIVRNKIRQIKSETEQRHKIALGETKLPKLGEIATYIARDILNMTISEQVKKKCTSPYINKLQNKIAYFSLNQFEIIELCEEMGLLNKTSGHVFLTKETIQNSTGLIDFYTKYLKEKLNWLKDEYVIDKNGMLKTDLTKIPLTLLSFINNTKAQASEEYFDQWLTNKVSSPVELPISLFDDLVIGLLKQKLKQNKEKFNSTEKFSLLLTRYIGNDTQPFYKYVRVYTIEEKEVEIKKVGNLSSKELKDTYNKFVESNEKDIRFYQTKDRIMKLMCESLIKHDNSLEIDESVLLKNIHPKSKTNPLNQAAKFEYTLFKNKANELKVVAEDSEEQLNQITAYKTLDIEKRTIWEGLNSKEDQDEFLKAIPSSEHKLYHGQKGYEWTLKDFGKFRRFVKDKRIEALATYFDTKNISFDFLDYQLKEYDRVRPAIFDLFFSLEEVIATKDFNGVKDVEMAYRKANGKNYHEVEFPRYQEWIVKFDSEFKEQLIKIGRDKFAHTQFPIIDNLTKISADDIAKFENLKHLKDAQGNMKMSIAQKIYDLYKLEMNTIIERIYKLSPHG